MLTRARLAALLCAFVAMVWLNQGPSLAEWKGRSTRTTWDRLAAPPAFLYRRAPDEELYFATASAVLGRPYDAKAFGIRGQTPLPPVDIVPDGRFHAPYAEVPFEYPPPSVPFILGPRWLAGSFLGYARLLAAMMGSLLVLAAVLAARLAPAEERPARLVGFALLLLAHGALAIQRLDAVVALLLVLVVRAADRKETLRLGVWAGLVGALKIVPIFVALVVLGATGARPSCDARRLLRFGAGAAVALVLGVLPMAVASVDSIRLLLRYHGARGLHVESALGTLYGAARAIAGAPSPGVLDFGSFNFHGALPDLLAKASPVLMLVLLAIVGRAAARGPFDRTQLVLAALGATLALWLGGKVFSPQYLTWALPLVIALPGRDWRRVTLAFGAILLLSQLYYRGFYDHVYLQRPLGVATMVVRLVLLVGLYVWVVRRLGGSISRIVHAIPSSSRKVAAKRVWTAVSGK